MARRPDHDDDAVEFVTPELAAIAQSLRTAFDLEPYVADSPERTPRMLVRREIADAIRSAACQVRETAWISLAIELVRDALVERVRIARGASPLIDGVPLPDTKAEDLYPTLQRQMRRLGFALPERVEVQTIAWMLLNLSVGGGRGGGRTRKLSESRMRALLKERAQGR